MEIISIQNGPFMVNTYVIIKGHSALIIDPGHDITDSFESLKADNIQIKAVLITHAHIDHVAGIEPVQKQFGAPVYLGSEDFDLMERMTLQSRMFGLPDMAEVVPDFEIQGKDITLNISDFEVRMIHTPGHSPGSRSFLIEEDLFTGDVLFRNSIGRTDLFGGSHSELIRSIEDLGERLDGDKNVHPGHGESTTLLYELKNNPFLNQNIR